MNTECTLTNEELIELAQEWVSSLAKTGGRSWSLQVPVNFNRDPDMIFLEICNRLKGATTWIPVTDKLPDLFQKCNFIVKSDRAIYHGRVYAGTYTGNPDTEYSKYEFSIPGIAFEASHWLPSQESIVNQK